MSDQNLDEMWALYRNELHRDYVPFSSLVWGVRHRRPELDDDQVKSAVLSMLEGGLRRREVQVGTAYSVGGLEDVWVDPIDEIMRRIAREWDALGRDPLPGEILWIDETQATER